MIVIETTPGCNATPRIVLLLEEIGATYRLDVKDDGYFLGAYGVPGPALVEDGFRLFEANAILRYLAATRSPGALMPADARAQAEVDRWIEFMVLRIGMSVVQGQMEDALRYLGVLDHHLAGREWICGSFTAADCGAAPLVRQSARLPLQRLPNLRAYLDRLAARQAFARAQARLTAGA